MCLIFIALKNHPKYKLVLAANRDEFYGRATAPAAFWHDHPEILGGRDLEAAGTWLGITTSGRISMVTNYRDMKNIQAQAPSRGQLVVDFLKDTVHAEQYLKKVDPQKKKYNGFNLICGTVDSLFYLSNYKEGIVTLNSGLFGLSNHLLETPWPKVEEGKRAMQAELKSPHVNQEHIFRILRNEAVASDDALPDTGVGLERERALSAAFIKSPGYGTRSSTVLLVDYENQVTFSERVFDLTTFRHTSHDFQFKIA